MSKLHLSFLAAVLCCALTAQAQSTAQPDKPFGAISAAERAERYSLIRKLVVEWGPYVEAIHHQRLADWADGMVPVFRGAKTTDLRRAARADTFGSMMEALFGNSAGGLMTTKSEIQETARSLFTTIAPCKMYDSRAGSMPPINSTIELTIQGCGIPLEANAVQMDVAAISPTQTGYFKLWPVDSSPGPQTSTISYSVGQNIQNEMVSRISYDPFRKMRLYSTGRAHLVLTVTGYFVAKRFPEPKLTCSNISFQGVIYDQVPGAEGMLETPTCPSSRYTAVSAGCTLGPSRIFLGAFHQPSHVWACRYRNTDNPPAGNESYSSTTTCCVVESVPPP